jgi:hypothetical protein
MPVDGSYLIKLKKVTVSYSPIEDRIRMTAQTESGDSIDFWLTLRLCREIVSVMAEQLSASVLQKTQARHAPAVESFLQRGAASRRTKAPPVAIEPSESHLLNKVQIQAGKRGLFLRIPMGDGMAVLPFKYDEARQWLAILFKHFQIAGWPLDFWPDWIKKSQTDEKFRDQSAVH